MPGTRSCRKAAALAPVATLDSSPWMELPVGPAAGPNAACRRTPHGLQRHTPNISTTKLNTPAVLQGAPRLLGGDEPAREVDEAAQGAQGAGVGAVGLEHHQLGQQPGVVSVLEHARVPGRRSRRLRGVARRPGA